jgi:hypothetical protein
MGWILTLALNQFYLQYTCHHPYEQFEFYTESMLETSEEAFYLLEMAQADFKV